jgi:hypothetical protein
VFGNGGQNYVSIAHTNLSDTLTFENSTTALQGFNKAGNAYATAGAFVADVINTGLGNAAYAWQDGHSDTWIVQTGNAHTAAQTTVVELVGVNALLDNTSVGFTLHLA